jgi:hypothetical protein
MLNIGSKLEAVLLKKFSFSGINIFCQKIKKFLTKD